MIILRSALFNVAFYALFVVMMILGLPLMLLPRAVVTGLIRIWATCSLWLLATICGARLEVRDRALLSKGAVIVAVKHQSFLETFALITVLDDFCYVLKKELLSIPVFGWYLRVSGQIAIDRAKAGGALLALQRAVRKKLAAGRQIIIFPEGTRQPLGAAPVYKPGVAALYMASGVPCTPIALNTGVFWPRKTFLRRPGTIVIQVLQPIEAGLPKRAFLQALENAIEPATDALVAEALFEQRREGVVLGETCPETGEVKKHPAAA